MLWLPSRVNAMFVVLTMVGCAVSWLSSLIILVMAICAFCDVSAFFLARVNPSIIGTISIAASTERMLRSTSTAIISIRLNVFLFIVVG